MAKEISGIKHKINKEFYKIYANHALKDSNNNVITATYLTTGDGKNISAAIAKKEDKLTFGYNEDKIISINSSALSAGTNYKAGPNIDLTNDVISGKDWKDEIESATSGKADKIDVSTLNTKLANEIIRAENEEKELNDKFSGYYTKTETSGKDQLSTEFNKKQDNLSQLQLSAISSVSAKYDASGISAYYTSSQVEDRLKTSGTYLTANALDSLSGGWNEVSGKLYTSSFDSRIAEYYKRTETSSAPEIQDALNKKQNNLTNEQLRAISSVSGISSDLANNYFTKTEIENKLNTSGNYLSANALDDVSGNWNEVSSKLDETAFNVYKTSAETEIAKKYDTSSMTAYYTTAQVEERLANFGGFEVVTGTGDDHHPNVQNPSTKIIYLVKVESSKIDNYKEWIYTTDHNWELIGDTTIDLTNYYTKTETSGKDQLSTEFNKKQDNLTNEQLSSISSVSSISSDLKTNYYTTGQIDDKLNASGNYLSANALDSLSGNWETVTAKLNTTAFDEFKTSAESELSKKFDTSAISDYYTKTETSGAQEISAALDDKQDNLNAGPYIDLYQQDDKTYISANISQFGGLIYKDGETSNWETFTTAHPLLNTYTNYGIIPAETREIVFLYDKGTFNSELTLANIQFECPSDTKLTTVEVYVKNPGETEYQECNYANHLLAYSQHHVYQLQLYNDCVNFLDCSDNVGKKKDYEQLWIENPNSLIEHNFGTKEEQDFRPANPVDDAGFKNKIIDISVKTLFDNLNVGMNSYSIANKIILIEDKFKFEYETLNNEKYNISNKIVNIEIVEKEL